MALGAQPYSDEAYRMARALAAVREEMNDVEARQDPHDPALVDILTGEDLCELTRWTELGEVSPDIAHHSAKCAANRGENDSTNKLARDTFAALTGRAGGHVATYLATETLAEEAAIRAAQAAEMRAQTANILRAAGFDALADRIAENTYAISLEEARRELETTMNVVEPIITNPEHTVSEIHDGVERGHAAIFEHGTIAVQGDAHDYAEAYATTITILSREIGAEQASATLIDGRPCQKQIDELAERGEISRETARAALALIAHGTQAERRRNEGLDGTFEAAVTTVETAAETILERWRGNRRTLEKMRSGEIPASPEEIAALEADVAADRQAWREMKAEILDDLRERAAQIEIATEQSINEAIAPALEEARDAGMSEAQLKNFKARLVEETRQAIRERLAEAEERLSTVDIINAEIVESPPQHIERAHCGTGAEPVTPSAAAATNDIINGNSSGGGSGGDAEPRETGVGPDRTDSNMQAALAQAQAEGVNGTNTGGAKEVGEEEAAEPRGTETANAQTTTEAQNAAIGV